MRKSCDIPLSFVPGWLALDNACVVQLKSRLTSHIMLAAADYAINKFGKITCAHPRDTSSTVFVFVAYCCCKAMFFCCLVNLWLLQLNHLCSVLVRNSNSRFQAAPMFVHVWSLVFNHDSPCSKLKNTHPVSRKPGQTDGTCKLCTKAQVQKP